MEVKTKNNDDIYFLEFIFNNLLVIKLLLLMLF